MPKLVSEISSGHQFSRSSENGMISDSQTRVFRIVLSFPGEIIDPTEHCQIHIGDPHPVNTNIYCTSFDIKFEGESRMVFLCTFQYQSSAGSTPEDPKSQPPDIRVANWSITTTLIELPVMRWKEVDDQGVVGPFKPAANPVGDLYDGVTTLAGMITFVFEQFDEEPPSRWANQAGCVNELPVDFPGLVCEPRTLMFRGASGRPAIEFWGAMLYRGWSVTYEFAYRADTWDIRIPQSGFNIFNAPYGSVSGAHGQNVEAGSLLLKHQGGKIKGWPGAIEPADGTGAEKTRAMVLVYEYENGGASQLPSAQPVPLNDDGAPRWSGANPKVLIKRYCPYIERTDVFSEVRI